MESRKTKAPLSLDPACSGAMPVPGVHRRSSPSCVPLSVLAGFGRASCHNSGGSVPKTGTAGTAVPAVRGTGLSRQQHTAQSHPGWMRVTRLRLSESPRQRGQLVQAGWSRDSHTQAFQSGSWLGREVEQAATLLIPFLAVLPCAARPMLGRKDGGPVCAAEGTEHKGLCPPRRGRCTCL